MKHKWLLFDADGTLFDYDHAELDSLKGTFEKFRVDFLHDWHRRYGEINLALFLKSLKWGSSLRLNCG